MRRENLPDGGQVIWKFSLLSFHGYVSWRRTTETLLGVSFETCLRCGYDIIIRRRGDVPLRRLSDVPLRRRWVFYLRRTCDDVTGM